MHTTQCIFLYHSKQAHLQNILWHTMALTTTLRRHHSCSPRRVHLLRTLRHQKHIAVLLKRASVLAVSTGQHFLTHLDPCCHVYIDTSLTLCSVRGSRFCALFQVLYKSTQLHPSPLQCPRSDVEELCKDLS